MLLKRSLSELVLFMSRVESTHFLTDAYLFDSVSLVSLYLTYLNRLLRMFTSVSFILLYRFSSNILLSRMLWPCYLERILFHRFGLSMLINPIYSDRVQFRLYSCSCQNLFNQFGLWALCHATFVEVGLLNVHTVFQKCTETLASPFSVL